MEQGSGGSVAGAAAVAAFVADAFPWPPPFAASVTASVPVSVVARLALSLRRPAFLGLGPLALLWRLRFLPVLSFGSGVSLQLLSLVSEGLLID